MVVLVLEVILKRILFLKKKEVFWLLVQQIL